jgi:hypothetical protein
LPHVSAERPALPRPRLSLKGALLFAAAMFVLMCYVYSNMELSRVNGEYRAAVLELQRLKDEESILVRQSEASLSLSEVEAYAIGELGMVKPTQGQYVYIGNPAEDHAEIIRHEGVFGSWRKIFSTIGIQIAEFFD